MAETVDARVAVAWEGGLEAEARALAARLGLPLSGVAAELLLVVTPERLELREVGAKTGPVFAEFTAGRVDHRRRFGGGREQPLARAVGLKGGATPRVLDATAGLGRDAFVLASLGCAVHLIERSVVVGALLEDGLERARQDAEVGVIASRLRLSVGDAVQVMRAPDLERPEVVYLDPMYPHAGKTALQKKEMRLFRRLVGADEDAPRLLEAALATASKRVVVKRPKNALPLGGPTPSMAVGSKNTRFDVYLTSPE